MCPADAMQRFAGHGLRMGVGMGMGIRTAGRPRTNVCSRMAARHLVRCVQAQLMTCAPLPIPRTGAVQVAGEGAEDQAVLQRGPEARLNRPREPLGGMKRTQKPGV